VFLTEFTYVVKQKVVVVTVTVVKVLDVEMLVVTKNSFGFLRLKNNNKIISTFKPLLLVFFK
jgi:hypothetical protein